MQHTPDTLLIHLKRFKQNSKGAFERNNVLVGFPVTGLNLSEFCGAPTNQSSDPVSCLNNNQIYDLSAVINHIHSKKHYTTLAKHADTGVWYEYDDRKCTPITTANITSHVGRRRAYILVYQRRVSYAARANDSDRSNDDDDGDDDDVGMSKRKARTLKSEKAKVNNKRERSDMSKSDHDSDVSSESVDSRWLTQTPSSRKERLSLLSEY